MAGGGGWGEAALRSPATRSSGLTLPLARLPRAAWARLPFAAAVRAKQASWACLFSPQCLVTLRLPQLGAAHGDPGNCLKGRPPTWSCFRDTF